MWLVHTWLPDAHVEQTDRLLGRPGGRAAEDGRLRLPALLGADAAAGILHLAPLIFTLSVVAVIYTSLVALAQEDMKKLIAYSSVAHMGVVTIGSSMTTRSVRQLTVAPNGDLYVALSSHGFGGGVRGYRDRDGDWRSRHAGELGLAGRTLREGPGGLSLSRPQRPHLWALRCLTPGKNLAPEGKEETMVSGLPDDGNHTSKSVVFGGGDTMFASIGSATNSCQRADRREKSPGIDPCTELERRAGIWQFSAGRRARRSPTGGGVPRAPHASALTVQPGTGQVLGRRARPRPARRQLGIQPRVERENPAEELVPVAGATIGWPYRYYSMTSTAKVLAPEYGGDGKDRPLLQGQGTGIAFPAHWAPMGLAFYPAASSARRTRNGLFVAFHGSWNRAPLPQAGYRVVFAPFVEASRPGSTRPSRAGNGRVDLRRGGPGGGQGRRRCTSRRTRTGRSAEVARTAVALRRARSQPVIPAAPPRKRRVDLDRAGCSGRRVHVRREVQQQARGSLRQVSGEHGHHACSSGSPVTPRATSPGRPRRSPRSPARSRHRSRPPPPSPRGSPRRSPPRPRRWSPGSPARRGPSERDRRCEWRWRRSPPARRSGAKPSAKLRANGAAPAAWTAARRGASARTSPSARASAQRLPERRGVPSRSPAGRTIQSGGSQPSCCSISSTMVFCPSIRNGLIELRRYTPSSLAWRLDESQAGVEVAAHEQRARAVGERLRQLAHRHRARDEHERGEPRLRGVGGERRGGVSGRRARHARRADRLACVTPTVIPRSLNEPVGLWPFVLEQQVRRARSSGRAPGRCRSGVFPSGCSRRRRSAEGRTISRKRHTPDARAPGRCPPLEGSFWISSSARLEVGRPAPDLEQPAAQGAARLRIEFGHLVAAGEARLPARRCRSSRISREPPVGHDSRPFPGPDLRHGGPHSGSQRARPCRAHALGRARRAPARTSWARFPRWSAERTGVERGRFASMKPGSRRARAGSAMRC